MNLICKNCKEEYLISSNIFNNHKKFKCSNCDFIAPKNDFLKIEKKENENQEVKLEKMMPRLEEIQISKKKSSFFNLQNILILSLLCINIFIWLFYYKNFNPFELLN